MLNEIFEKNQTLSSIAAEGVFAAAIATGEDAESPMKQIKKYPKGIWEVRPEL